MIKITFYRPRIFTREFWRQWKQRRKQGFIDEDTYSLYNSLAEFILPRLRRFRYQAFPDHLGTRDGISRSSWCQMVDKMIWSMNEIVENDGSYPTKEPPDFSDEGMIKSERKRRIYYQRLQEGLTLFGRYFRGLWW